MKLLLDTNVVLALLNELSPERTVAAKAIVNRTGRGDTWWLAPQVLIEFRAVATRPRTANGLGWTLTRVRLQVERLLQTSLLLEETPRLFPAWLELVARHGVAGKRVHDARLAAMMLVHGITHVLTFDAKGFPVAWGITTVASSARS